MTSYIPSAWVSIGGLGDIAPNLREVRIQQTLGLPAMCEVCLEGISTETFIKIGSSLEVCIQETDEVLFHGDVTAVEYIYPPDKAPYLRVRGYDLLHRLRKRQHVEAYSDTSLEQLLHSLAGRNSELVGKDLTWPLLIQHQQNDLEFLAEQAALAGRYPLARAGKIYLIPLSGLNDQLEIQLSYGRNLFEARIEANADADCGEVTAYGWEIGESGTLHVKEKTAETGRDVGFPVNVTDTFGTPERMLINQSLAGEDHARALARAELERRKAGNVVLWGRAEGSHSLQPGIPVLVTGVAEAVAGRYVLTTALHTFDYMHGYTVEFSSAPPSAPPRSRCDVSTLGVVSSVGDPRQMGRVRAHLPGYANVETGWMPVICPGAGAGKGLFTPPAPGDHVLVLLAREDPAQGFILGGIYTPEKVPGDCIGLDQTHGYTWTTHAGQKIHLDQHGHLVLIENGEGAAIEMKGKEIIIRAGKIDFEKVL